MRKYLYRVGAIGLFALSPVASSHAQTRSSVSAICRSIVDDRARLACYDRGGPSSVPTPPLPTSPVPHAQGASAPPASNFGRRAQMTPTPRTNVRQITANVVSYTFDGENKFTVSLDNGQIWRQFDADFGNARFREHGRNTVVITRGFWDSYNLKLNAMSAVFRVARVK